MATKKPLAPSMIFRSRMTNMSSNVMLQKACSLSLLPELSSMSLMRTSVISTVVLLYDACGEGLGSGTAGHDPDLSQPGRCGGDSGGGRFGRASGVGQAEVGRATPAHLRPDERRAIPQGVPDLDQGRAEGFGGRLEAIVQEGPDRPGVTRREGVEEGPDRDGPVGRDESPVD